MLIYRETAVLLLNIVAFYIFTVKLIKENEGQITPGLVLQSRRVDTNGPAGTFMVMDHNNTRMSHCRPRNVRNLI